MPAIAISPVERRELRGRAHHIDPVVLIGTDGATPAVLKEAEAALSAHGLIKIRVFSDDRAAREALLASLSDALGAAAVQHIGKLLVLWRPIPEKPKLRDEKRGPGAKHIKIVVHARSGNHRPTIKRIKLLGNQRIAAGGTVKRLRSRLESAKKKASG
jgi:RNA-binding protein